MVWPNGLLKLSGSTPCGPNEAGASPSCTAPPLTVQPSPSASLGGRSPLEAATGPDGAAVSGGLGANPSGAPNRLPTVSSGGLLPLSAMLPPADLHEFLRRQLRTPAGARPLQESFLT